MKPVNRITVLFTVTIMCVLALSCTGKETDWHGSIRSDHPRLFFNTDTWPDVKARALGAEDRHPAF